MSGQGADALYVALNAALDGLSAFADASVRSVKPHPVLLLHPLSSRPNATNALIDAKARLELFTTACQSASRRLDDIIAKARRSQHDCELALAPISSLPDEVLLQIFELAIAPSSDRRKPSITTIVSLSQVCSAWRNSAREHSGLWSEFFVDQQTSIEVFNQRVERSKAKGLSVTVVDKIPKLPTDTLHVSPRWLETLEDLVWRSSSWADDLVEVPRSFEEYDQPPILRNPASFRALKSLTLDRPACDHCQGSTWAAINFFNNFSFPQLKALVLGRGVELTYVHAIRAPHLTSLHLESVDCGEITVLDELLQSLPTLENLIVGNIHAREKSHYSMTFKLPRLHSLSTRSLPAHIAVRILQPSRYPTLHRWEFADWESAPCKPGAADVLRMFGRAFNCLEHISAICTWDRMQTILLPLKPAEPPKSVSLTMLARASTSSPADSTPASAAPMLRTLDVSLWQGFGQARVKSNERSFFAFMQGLLQSRVEGGCARIEELTLGTTVPQDAHIERIKRLVGKLTVGDHKRPFF